MSPDKSGLYSSWVNADNAEKQQEGFLFLEPSISTGGPPSRRNARSFVMQRARREKPWSTSKHAGRRHASNSYMRKTFDGIAFMPALTYSAGVAEQLQQAEQFPPLQLKRQSALGGGMPKECMDCSEARLVLGTCDRCQAVLSKALSLTCQTGSFTTAFMDPFDSLPIRLDTKSEKLIDHFLTIQAPNLMPIDIRSGSKAMAKEWLGNSLHDKAAMHALLCSLSLHMCVLGKDSYMDVMVHKAEALTAINVSLSNRDQQIMNSTLHAVFSMLCIEEAFLLPELATQQDRFNSSVDARRIHLNGLKRMLDMRGGIHGLDSYKTLQAFILWHSSVHSIASFQPSYVAVPERPQDRRRDSLMPKGTAEPSSDNWMAKLCSNLNLRQEIVDIIEDLGRFTVTLSNFFEEPSIPGDPLDIQILGSLLEHRLLALLTASESERSLDPVATALCIALLMYDVYVTRTMKGTHQALHQTALSRLRTALDTTTSRQWEACPAVLLWISSIGAICAQGFDEVSFFLEFLSATCSWHEVQSSQDYLSRLRRCLWVPYKLDAPASELWQNVVDHMSSFTNEPTRRSELS